MMTGSMSDGAESRGADWKEVDTRLRELARQSASQDWEIGCALLLARQTRAHERLGFASLFEYVGRLFGYTERVTAERLRVAEDLRVLPALEGALRAGDRNWSAIRELTRVAVDETDREWLDFSAGKTVRELEHAVSGLRPGDRPGDAPDPHLVRKIIRVEVSPEGWGLFKDAMARLRREVDQRLSEEDAFMELCRRALGAASDPGATPYQVALTVCDHCGRTWQDAGGETLELPPEVGERAGCDAQHVGRVDHPSPAGSRAPGAAPTAGDEAPRRSLASAEALEPDTTQPPRGDDDEPTGRAPAGTHVGVQRATRTIPPATRRQVLRRDRGRCRAPGCRSHIWLDLHHVVPRSEGGTHDPAGILVLCGAHHALLHRGLLVIEGTTEQDARFLHADGTPYGAPPRPAEVQASSEAFAALRSLGFGETESRLALTAARTHVGAGASTEELVTAVLRAHQHQPSRAA